MAEYQQWEYKEEYLGEPYQRTGRLRELGQAGWEVVAIMPGSYYYPPGPDWQRCFALCKRPVGAQAAAAVI